MSGWVQLSLRRITRWLRQFGDAGDGFDSQKLMVECPQGHQTYMSREELLQKDLSPSDRTYVQWGMGQGAHIKVSTVDCPYPGCERLARHTGITS